MNPRLQDHLLAEFVYRRVSEMVRVDDLALLEQELAAGVGRRLGGTDVDRADAASAVRAHFDRAWQRIEHRWQQFRTDPTAAAYESDCPLCTALAAGELEH
ncbi:MAG: hypothetical protein D6689_07935 [Deltaproteobacteria bacterium]|nr:MAG: hypothetical protein D6689_07935 [Deltaproteobacteria bacterium]